MRGFDLYRITLAYLGVVFALCAVVVFDPLRWVWPGAAPGTVAVSVPSLEQRSVPVVAAPMAVAAAEPAGPRAPAGPVDPAEVVAELVAQAFAAEFGEEVGEGDASAQRETGPDPLVARVGTGLDVAYTVGPGESLGSLALRFYGDSALAPLIYQANRGLMASPDNLRVGQVVIIPGRS